MTIVFEETFWTGHNVDYVVKIYFGNKTCMDILNFYIKSIDCTHNFLKESLFRAVIR